MKRTEIEADFRSTYWGKIDFCEAAGGELQSMATWALRMSWMCRLQCLMPMPLKNTILISR